jgi:thiol-disulfide isomerase/thioredoxin
MQQNTLLILLASTIALAGGIFVQSLSNKDQKNLTIPALEFSLPDVSGKQHSLSEWQGKIRIINFWATWCPPCLEEIPEFINLQNDFKDKNLQFIGIAVEDKQAVEQYLKTIPINYPMLIGGEEGIALSQQLGNIINAVPFTVFVNQQGQIVYRHPGELSREKILEIITPLF